MASSAAAFAQLSNDPFPQPIAATEGVVKVNFKEFASLPDSNGQNARMMLLIDEPGTKRLFVNDMNGPLYTISYDGKTVTPYVNINDEKWGVGVQFNGNERGMQSFALHPQFGQRGARGYGKFYTLTDTTNKTPAADFKPNGGTHTHDTVLLEWTAKTPAAPAYDGGPPRELIRWEQPFSNHNGGHITFNPLARQNSPDYGLLYIGFADGGSGGDPLNNAQNLSSSFGKILRIDPLSPSGPPGLTSANGRYGIPPSNPFANDNNPATLGEIYAYGVRNPQHLFWDPKNGSMLMSDIGQNTVEEISPVTAGANLGWNVWEGSYKYIGREGINLSDPHSDAKITYPIVEYGQVDPLLQPNSAAIGGYVYRQKTIPQLTNKLLFGDNPSGEIFYVDADNLPKGGQDPIHRVLLNDKREAKTLLQVIKEKNASQGKPPATRADLRFGQGPNGEIFILNKRDGTIRELVP